MNLLFWNQVLCCVPSIVGRSIKTALSAGSALAFTSAYIDLGGQTLKHDEGKEYAAYTTKKRTSGDE